MQKLMQCFILFASALSIMSCSEEKPVTFSTYSKEYTFKLSNRFEKNKKFDDLDFFDNGKYRIQIETNAKTDVGVRKIFEECRTNPEKTYRNSSFMTFHHTEFPAENEEGYPTMAFYGGGKDKSSILPVYYEGYFFMMETPYHFVRITLKHTARTSNAMDKNEAINYLIPMIKTFREATYR